MKKNKAVLLAKPYMDKDSVVVSHKGDIYVNSDIDAVCSEMESRKEEFHIVKGERVVKAVKTKADK